MDLNKTSDFNKAFNEYCTSVGLSCYGCKIQKASSIPCSEHAKRSSCLAWALSNLDLAQSILQEYLDTKPFIPGFGEHYYYVTLIGEIDQAWFNKSHFNYMCVLTKNCFRTKEAARQNRDKVLARYAAIDSGKYPD